VGSKLPSCLSGAIEVRPRVKKQSAVTGERLRIGAGVNPTALRRVLEALRA